MAIVNVYPPKSISSGRRSVRVVSSCTVVSCTDTFVSADVSAVEAPQDASSSRDTSRQRQFLIFIRIIPFYPIFSDKHSRAAAQYTSTSA